jgi:PAS domain S-box-containing protein
MSLNREFSEMVQKQNNSFRFIHPLIGGQEFSPVVKQNSRWMLEVTALHEMALKREWKNLPELMEPLHNPSVAVVVTDARERIKWVSEGFYRMTGYEQEEVLMRKPGFLQGEETDKAILQQIRQALNLQQPSEGTLLNYRKNGEPYYCNIAITPLLNHENKLVNFIAVEQEVFSF